MYPALSRCHEATAPFPDRDSCGAKCGRRDLGFAESSERLCDLPAALGAGCGVVCGQFDQPGDRLVGELGHRGRLAHRRWCCGERRWRHRRPGIHPRLPRRPCHQRGIRSGHDRAGADTNGQHDGADALRSCSRTDKVSAQLRRRRAAARRSRGRSGMPDSGFRSIEYDPGRLPPEINTSVAHPARRYDYWLGGKDNFPADREAGEAVAAVFPSVRIGVLENRRFMCRAVRFLARELGIRQFLDIGTGIPTSPNVHEVVQAVDPASRVVYVDNDPIVLVHARALLTSSPEGATAYIDADLREPEKILNHPDLLRTLDLSQPTGLLLVAILHFIMDAAAPYRVVGRLVGAMPSGSHLVVSHVTADPMPPEVFARIDTANAAAGIPFRFRTREEFAHFLDGLEPVPPGIQSIAKWRAEGERPPPPAPP